MFTGTNYDASGHFVMNEMQFTLKQAYLPFSHELSMIVIRRVSGDLPSPQSHSNDSVSDAHHYQGQDVDQNCHYDMIPGGDEK